MVNLPGWQRYLILFTLVLGVIFAFPNSFYPRVEAFNDANARIALDQGEPGDEANAKSWPSWLPSNLVSLGLDLRGGVHLLAQVELEQVHSERYDEVWAAIRDRLASDANRSQYGAITKQDLDEGFSVVIENAQQISNAQSEINLLFEDLGISGFTTEFEGDSVRIGLTDGAKQAIDQNTMNQSLEIVRRRIDATGTKEPTIQQIGDDRISIDVPGAASVEEVLVILDKTAKLTLHQVLEVTNDANLRVNFDEILAPGSDGKYYRLAKSAAISGDMIIDAFQGFEQQSNLPIVNFRLNPEGAKKFGDYTSQHIGERFAIVLDGEVISAPSIRSAILQGAAYIEGDFTVDSAVELAALLKSGALPADLVVLEQSVVGPDMGEDSIDAGKIASVISVLGVALFILWIYRRFGIYANIALAANMILIIAALSVIGSTLTLPGIAGIILTIGMAVDANVLIFERIREEYRQKPVVVRAIDQGFARALTSILDANITTFIAASILYVFGAGPVKGFAITLMVGIVTSVFTAVYVTRLFVVWYIERKRPKVLAMHKLPLLKEDTQINFMRFARPTLYVSLALMAASVFAFGFKGLNYGIDFKGGTEMRIEVAETVSVADVRGLFSNVVGGDVSVVSETGAESGSQFLKVRLSSSGEEAAMSEDVISNLKSMVASEFEGGKVRGVEAIGGAVSAELVQKGLMAIGLTLCAIAVYIWLRFEWAFSMGAIFALAHDVVLTVGLFVITGVTFDLSVVAAILAIIGYSLNDTVIVYDRIREKISASKSAPLSDLVNKGLNETLPRTLMTSGTTLISVGVLYLLGGEELRAFSFAMIWGVIVGTYSSIFIASPILTIIGVDREDKPKATTKFADIDA